MNSVGRVMPALMMLAVSSTSAVAETHQPTGPWHVQFDGVQCVGLREYGTEAEPVTLALKPSPSGGVMRIILITKGSVVFLQFQEKLRFDRRKIETNALLYSDETKTRRLLSINVPMAQFRANLQAHSIDMNGRTFAISDMEKVVGGLDSCLLQLRDRWNIGDQYASRVSTQAEGSLQGLLQPTDYPKDALVNHQQGKVGLTMLVDVDGRIPDCGVDETSGSPFLDVASCYYITRRAHFRPALGRDGKPIRSSVTQAIVWRIGY